MVCSNNKAEQGDSPHRVNHSEGSESIPLGGEMNDNLRDHPETGQNQNIDFGVSKKSK